MRKIIFSIGLILGCFFIAILLLNMNLSDTVEYNIYTKGFKPIQLDAVGDADPGSGASGMLMFFVYPHAADPGLTYATNITSGWYANSSVNNTHAGSNVPYSTAFDLCWKVRFNVTHAWNGTAFDSTYTRGYLNCTGLSVTSQIMTKTQIATGGDYVYYTFWIQDTNGGNGTGFTITKGQNVTTCLANWEAYF